MSGLGKVTSVLPKRASKLPAYLCSPFLQHFGSSSKESVEATDVKCLKGISPLDKNNGNLPPMDESSDYYNWLDKGLLMNKNRKKFYSKEDNDISPPIKLGCEIISEKTWFHTIEYGSSNFSNSHVDVFFYYLRKLSKYSGDCKMNFTTSDCKLQKSIASLYADISESDDIQSKITAKQGSLDVLNGVVLPFSTPWYLVDNVFFPIWLTEKKHWVLAVINFKERVIRVKNTLSCEGIALIVRNALLPLSTILPNYLLLTEFYSRTDINFSAKCYTGKSKTDCFRSIMQNDYVCGQSIDSGIAMISIVEYLILDKAFPKAYFDIAVHRSRI